MDESKVLYSICVKDVLEIADQLRVKVKEKDLKFIEDKIGDFFGDKWVDAIDFALDSLEEYKGKKKKA